MEKEAPVTTDTKDTTGTSATTDTTDTTDITATADTTATTDITATTSTTATTDESGNWNFFPQLNKCTDNARVIFGPSPTPPPAPLH